MNIFIAILLGLIQGLTEFIPVSSSGHLELFEQLMGARPDDFHFFLELINLGTLLALIIFFRKRIWGILGDIFKRKKYRLAINVIITCIPAGVAGLILSDFIETNPFFSSLYTVAIAMGVVGFLMVKADKLPHVSRLKSEDNLTPGRALGIGIAQVAALIPGVSRSGSTIVAGRVAGLSNASAAEYSFLVSIPLMAAVCLKTLVSSSTMAYVAANWQLLLVSNIVAFIFGVLALRFVMDYLKRPGALKAFGYYRLILAGVVLAYLLLQV